MNQGFDQGGLVLAPQRSAEGLPGLREEFLVKTNATFDQMFGQDGKNGLLTFTEREDRACEVTDALARWLLEEHLSLDEGAGPGGGIFMHIIGPPVKCPDQRPGLR